MSYNVKSLSYVFIARTGSEYRVNKALAVETTEARSFSAFEAISINDSNAIGCVVLRPGTVRLVASGYKVRICSVLTVIILRSP